MEAPGVYVFVCVYIIMCVYIIIISSSSSICIYDKYFDTTVYIQK